MKKRTIIFLDNERTLYKTTISRLNSILYEYKFFTDLRVILTYINKSFPDVVVLNIKSSFVDDFSDTISEVISNSKDLNIKAIVIIDSENQNIVNEYYQLGAYYVFCNANFQFQQMIYQIKNAIELKQQEEENISLQIENLGLKKNLANLYPFIGESNCIKEAKSRIVKLAQADEDIFILGETGTGKEVAAHHYYLNSPRFAKAFQTVNCSALTESLIESELFGHIKGAYTDADKSKTGYFEKCNEGVLFLDEISNLSISAQSKILRAIENKEIQIVGGELKQVDTKLIFASNKTQKELIAPDILRQDLYYRIEGNIVELKPLRERGCDILTLMGFFFSSFSAYYQGIEEVFNDLLDHLMSYSWPGNIRELKNFCKFILINENELNKSVILKHLENKIKNCIVYENPVYMPEIKLKDALANYEKEFLSYHLIQNNWQLQKTAKKLGIERTTLYKKMKLHKINSRDHDENLK